MTTKAEKRQALREQIAAAQAELQAIEETEWVEPKVPGTVLVWTRTFPASAREYTYVAVLRTDGKWQSTLQSPPLTWDELTEAWNEISAHRWVLRPHKASRFSALAEK